MKKTTYYSGAAAFALAALMLVGNSTSAFAATIFTRDLTVGSTGGDVSVLQSFLIGHGFSVPAGATGYFGSQTKAALSSYQATKGIVPAVGYFGPITRAQVNSTPDTGTVPGSGTVTPPGGTTTTPVLSGSEATLRNFKLVTEDSEGHEGDTGVKLATASFDVRDGDINIQRIELTATAANSSLNTQPWRYFKSIAVMDGSKTLTIISVDDRSDWDQESNGTYTLNISGINDIVRKNSSANITLRADIASSIDSVNQSQLFTLSIARNGIRAVDAKNIQQYTGSDSSSVRFAFAAQESGDISVRTDASNPDASVLVESGSRESKAYTVLSFNLKNSDSVDALLTDATFQVNDLANGTTATDVLRRAYLTVDGKKYTGTVNASTISFKRMNTTVHGNAVTEGTLSVTLARNATSTPISFALDAVNVSAEGKTSGDDSELSGTATSRVHVIAKSGIEVTPGTMTTSVVTPNDVSSSMASYVIKWTVRATDDDAFIAASAATSSPAGVMYQVTDNDFAGDVYTSLTSTAKLENGYYHVFEGQTETFTLSVTLNPETAGFYGVGLTSVTFNNAGTDVDATTLQLPQNNSYATDPVYIPS